MIRFSVKGLEISIVPVDADESEDLDELAALIPAKPKILWYYSSGTDPEALFRFSDRLPRKENNSDIEDDPFADDDQLIYSLPNRVELIESEPLKEADIFVYTDIGRYYHWDQITEAYNDWHPENEECLYWPGRADVGCENSAFEISKRDNPKARQITTMIRVRMDFNPPVPTCNDSKRESWYRHDGGMDNYYELASDGTHNLKSCDGYAILVSHGKKTFPVLWLLLRNEVALEVIGRLRFPVHPYWRASNVDNEMMKRSIRRCQTDVIGGYYGGLFKRKIYYVAGRCLEFILADISFAVGKGSPYDAVFAFPWSKERLVWWNTPSGTKLNFIQDHKAPTKEVFGRILQFPAVKIAAMPFGKENDNECLVEWLEGKLWADSAVRQITLYYIKQDDWRDIFRILEKPKTHNTKSNVASTHDIEEKPAKKETFTMEAQNITQLISQLTVPSSDDGKKFIRTDRLDLITQALRNSDYNCLADLPLAKIYSHRDFQKGKPSILVSCHIDSVYEEYFARLQGGELHGTFDNSACNALLVEAMLQSLLPAQALVTFTGDEENKSRGADRTIGFLQKIDVFQKLEMVISLDLTEEHFGSCHFTIENHSVEKKNSESLLKFGKKQDMVDYLSAMIDSPVFVKNAEPDESWLYREYDLNCFTLCLPCRLLGEDMHDDTGVAIKEDSVTGYIEALRKLTQGINENLNAK